MLIHPWDAALDETEWRAWLAAGHDFGQLIVTGEEWPVVVPTHFVVDGPQILLHLARPNPVWAALEASGRAVLSVVDDYAYVPSYWRLAPDAPEDTGIPTSYYAAVQLRCTARVVDDPDEKAGLLVKQLEHMQPQGRYAAPDPQGAHARSLPGIRGLRLTVVEALVKFKYDDHKPADLQHAVNAELRARDQARDQGAAAQQQRRMTQAHRDAATP